MCPCAPLPRLLRLCPTKTMTRKKLASILSCRGPDGHKQTARRTEPWIPLSRLNSPTDPRLLHPWLMEVSIYLSRKTRDLLGWFF